MVLEIKEKTVSDATLTLIVLAIVAFLFISELIPLAITSIGATIALGVLGILSPNEVFSGLSNSTVVLFAGMFVVGAAMLESGLAQSIGTFVVRQVGTRMIPLMSALMIVTVVMSAFASNTGTVACLLPVIIGICAAARLPVSPLLMALAIAANTGGTITMVGTPPNLIAVGALQTVGLKPFSFFEFAYIGIPISIVSLLYMVFIGRRLVPQTMANLEISSTEQSFTGSRNKRIICAIILLYVICGICFKIPGLSPEMVAISGALLCVLTGVISERQAYNGIDWITIFLFAGMLPLATALEKTGAGDMIAQLVVDFIGNKPTPIILMTALFALSCGLTQFMSNTAAAALLCPIGISIANKIGISPYPVLMAIAIAASCAFTTPVATPPNTLIMGPGGFSFKDYIIVGMPLVILCLIVCVVVIPWVWPFYV